MATWFVLITGPAIVSFMMVAGAVIASVSAFSALLVAVFIIPAAIGLVFTFASVAGGLAVGASTLAIVFGAVALMVGGLGDSKCIIMLLKSTTAFKHSGVGALGLVI